VLHDLLGEQRLRQADAVERGQHELGDHGIGTQAAGERQRRLAVGGLEHNAPDALERAAQRAAVMMLLVHDEHARPLACRRSARGDHQRHRRARHRGADVAASAAFFCGSSCRSSAST